MSQDPSLTSPPHAALPKSDPGAEQRLAMIRELAELGIALRLTFALEARMDQHLADLRAGRLDRAEESARDYSSAGGTRLYRQSQFLTIHPQLRHTPNKNNILLETEGTMRGHPAANPLPKAASLLPKCCQGAANSGPLAARKLPANGQTRPAGCHA